MKFLNRVLDVVFNIIEYIAEPGRFALFGALLLVFLFFPTSSNNAYIQDHANEVWAQSGFEVVSNRGYTLSPSCSDYGGANRYYLLKRIPDNGMLYNGVLSRWGDEIHIQGVEAVEKGLLANGN